MIQERDVKEEKAHPFNTLTYC